LVDTYDKRCQLGASRRRLEDAQSLLIQKRWTGATYLGGYAIECSLKSLICHEEGQSNFKDTRIFKNRLQGASLHSLTKQQVQVFVKRTSLSWLRIRIIANSFEGKTLVEREDIIDRLLTSFNSELNLGQYPIAGYDLLTPQEASEKPPEYIQLPLGQIF
jgi:stress-induced morphogen